MDTNAWLSLIISILLSLTGLSMAYKSGVALAKIEELNRTNNRMIEEFTFKLLNAQTEVLQIALGFKRVDSVEDVTEQIERLRNQVLSSTETKRIP